MIKGLSAFVVFSLIPLGFVLFPGYVGIDGLTVGLMFYVFVFLYAPFPEIAARNFNPSFYQQQEEYTKKHDLLLRPFTDGIPLCLSTLHYKLFSSKQSALTAQKRATAVIHRFRRLKIDIVIVFCLFVLCSHLVYILLSTYVEAFTLGILSLRVLVAILFVLLVRLSTIQLKQNLKESTTE